LKALKQLKRSLKQQQQQQKKKNVAVAAVLKNSYVLCDLLTMFLSSV